MMSSFWQDLNHDSANTMSVAYSALVQVRSGRRGAGAGIIWRAEGLIITNAHVIRRSSPKVVLEDGREFQSQVLGMDTENDLAALAIEANDLPAIPMGDSQALRSGEVVTAMGYPWGITGSITTGVVVATGKNLPDMPGGDRDLISVSLHLRPGYSGGPLVNARGEVVGVNVMMAGPDVGLAIPSHVVQNFLKALAEEQSRHIPNSQGYAQAQAMKL
jgi:serine protease Do